MRALRTMTWTEAKLFLREPAAAFFTLAFPLILLLVFGSIFGNDPVAEFGGRGTVDVSVPGYIAMIIGTVGLIGLPVSLAAYREAGILRRLRATPLHPATILGAHVIVSLTMTVLGVALLVGAGRIIYELTMPDAPIATALAAVLGGLSFFALGFVLAGVLPTSRVAQAVGSAVYFPMLFLSGAAIPRQIMPDGVRRVADALPLTQVVILVEDLWIGDGWNQGALAMLAGIFAVAVVVAVRTFRWE